MNLDGPASASPEKPPAPPVARLPDVTVRQVVQGTLLVLALAGGFWMFLQFGSVLFSLFTAMVLGTALRPGLDWLSRRGPSRRTSAVIIYLTLVGLLVGFVLVLLPLLIEQATAFASKAPDYAASLREHMMASSSLTLKRIALDLPSLKPDASVPSSPITAAQIVAGLHLLGSGGFTAFAVLLLGFYWSLEGEIAIRALLLFVHLERREAARELIEAAEAIVGDYVRGQFVVCCATGSMSLVAFLVLGLPNALVLALIAGAMGAVPIFGAPLGCIPPLLVAASTDAALIPWILAVALGVHILQDYVIAPRVMKRSVGVHPFVVLLAISGFGSLFGPAGAILAIPIAAILQLLLDRFVFDADHLVQPVPARRDRVSILRLEAKQLALDVRRQGRELDEDAGDPDAVAEMVESLANDIDRALGARDRDPGPLNARGAS